MVSSGEFNAPAIRRSPTLKRTIRHAGGRAARAARK
jgi:hypothetical protein